MDIKTSKNIEKLKPYQPGKPIEELSRELGMPVGDIIKLASNENPLGPSTRSVSAMRAYIRQVHRYPDGDCFYLKERLASRLGVKRENLIIGNGSDEILEIAAKVFLHKKEQAIMTKHAFLEYSIITKTREANPDIIPMRRHYNAGLLAGFEYDMERIIASINSRTKIIFLGNPDNPTGAYLKKSDLDTLFKKCPKSVLIVIDEAYRELVNADDYIDTNRYINRNNVVILRTFSKAYGLAGLRIGYAIANREIISLMNRVRQPFNVNMLAQVAAQAALDDDAHVDKVKKIIAQGMRYLSENLQRLGFDVIVSPANFLLFSCRGMTGTELFEGLLPRGIIVRDMKPYGLKTWARVSAGTREENKKFIDAVKGFTAHKRTG
jgi:histidinol-phosphate aminotransferase